MGKVCPFLQSITFVRCPPDTEAQYLHDLQCPAPLVCGLAGLAARALQTDLPRFKAWLDHSLRVASGKSFILSGPAFFTCKMKITTVLPHETATRIR